MRKIFTEEDGVSRCNELNLEYVGSHKEYHTGNVVEFICKIHRDRGVQSMSWSHLKTAAKGCKYCAKVARCSHEEAQSRVKNPNIIFVSKYKGVESPVDCFCKECKNTWTCNRPMDLFKRECGCPTCSLKAKARKRLTSQIDFENKMFESNPDIEIIGEYKGTHKYVKCKCRIDGHIWESIACNLLNGTAGCPACNMSVGERHIIEFMEELKINYTKQKTFDDLKDVKHLKFDVFDNDHNIAIEFQGEQHYSPNWYRDKVKEFLLENVKEYKERYIA